MRKITEYLDLRSFLTMSRLNEQWKNRTALRLMEAEVELRSEKDSFLIHSLNQCRFLEKLIIIVTSRPMRRFELEVEQARKIHVSLCRLKFLKIISSDEYKFVLNCESLRVLDWSGRLRNLILISPKSLDKLRVYVDLDWYGNIHRESTERWKATST